MNLASNMEGIQFIISKKVWSKKEEEKMRQKDVKRQLNLQKLKLI